MLFSRKRTGIHCPVYSWLLGFLYRQGLPLRGSGDDVDGNFLQYLSMKAKQDTNLVEWLKKNENVYTSPSIPNEVIKTIGLKILR